jgi:hypothetical protein
MRVSEGIDDLAEQIALKALKCGSRMDEMKGLHRLLKKALEAPDIESKKKNLLLVKPKIAYAAKKDLTDAILPIIDSTIASRAEADYANLEILNDMILGYFVGILGASFLKLLERR